MPPNNEDAGTIRDDVTPETLTEHEREASAITQLLYLLLRRARQCGTSPTDFFDAAVSVWLSLPNTPDRPRLVYETIAGLK